MLYVYFKSAFRILIRNRLFSSINIFGLALSMSICLIVIHHVRDQLSYDKFHPERDKISRVITELTDKEGRLLRLASTPLPLGEALAKDNRGLELITRLYPTGSQKVSTGAKKLSISARFTDDSFLKMFGFRLMKGDPETALARPGNIILTESAATRLFGEQEAMSKILQVENFGDFLVTGILKDSIGKSHIDCDAYFPMSAVLLLEKEKKLNPAIEIWNSWSSGYTYVKSKEGYRHSTLQKSLDDISRNLISTSKLNGKENIKFDIQPLTEIILGEELMYSIGNVGSRGKMAAEVLIAFIILLSAAFNYTNLSIARSLKRGREVGIRKVAGATRRQVFIQFIIESMLHALLAFVLSYIFFVLLIDYAPFLAGGISGTLLFDDPVILIWFLCFTAFTGLLAGSLPAIALSAFKPVEVLKNLSQVKIFGGIGFRRALIVAQFTLALIITIFAGVFSRQFDYMADADPGYARNNMLIVSLKGSDYKIVSDQLANQSGVVQVSAISKSLGRGPSGSSSVRYNQDKDPLRISHFDVDSGFVSVAGLHFLAGNTFKNRASIYGETELLVNMQFIRMLGLSDPATAIGQQLVIDDSIKVNIAGVVSDFHFHGMESGIAPLVLRNRSDEFMFLQLKTNAKSAGVELAVSNTLNRINPLEAPEYFWLKDRLHEQQSAGDMVSTLSFLSFMAICIATMGLLGMVVYITQTREKEIGIRKILGAGVGTVMYLLARSFLKLVLLAGVIALPLGYISGFFFLQMFATRISLGAEILLYSFGGILVITLITICSQVYKVAIANPVNSLRNE